MALKPKAFCDLTGLSYETKDSIFYGVIDGYPVTLDYKQNKGALAVSIACKPDPDAADNGWRAAMDAWRTETKGVTAINYREFCLRAVFMVFAKKPHEVVAEQLRSLLDLVSRYGLQPCCQSCGGISDYHFYTFDGAGLSVCASCRDHLERNMDEIKMQKGAERPNLLGLLAGMLIGEAVLFLITYGVLRLGYLTFLTGFVGTFITFALMRKFGKKLTIAAAAVAAVLAMVIGVAVPVLDFAQDVAEFNRENAVEMTEFNEAFDSLNTDQLDSEQIQSLEAATGISVTELKARRTNYRVALANQSTGDCLRNFSAIWECSLYEKGHSSLIANILWVVLTVLICTALTAPSVLRESYGVHDLKELGA